MIAILKSTAQGMEVLTEVSTGGWINVVDPSAEEVARLYDMGIPPEFITYPLDVDERARVEKEDGVTLVVLRIPIFEGHSADPPYTTVPLGIVLTEEWIVTICKRESELLRDFGSGRVKGLSTNKRNRFILQLLLAVAARYLSYLREINRAVDSLEDQLQLSMKNRELLGLLKYQKSLVYFTTALKSNELMMERLQRSRLFHTYPDDQDLLEDVLTENQQAIEMTNIASNILSSMMDAFASIISNNVNVVMKFLAGTTILLMLPTLITSFFGMNVPLPWQDQPLTTVIILLLCVILGITVLRIFLKRDWM